MKKWFSITAKSNGVAEILIYDEIGIYGISAKKFVDELRALGNVKKITLRLNSPGGDVIDGLAIYNSLARHPAELTVVVDGIAASMASVVAMAGKKLLMPNNTFLMIHNPAGLVLGDADDMRSLAAVLDSVKKSLVGAYVRKSGQPEEKINEMMNAETWLPAEEALALGFADEVIEPTQMAALFDLARFSNAPSGLSKPADTPPGPTPAPEPTAMGPEAIRAQAKTEAIGAERQRVNAIAEACRAAGRPELAAEIIATGVSAEEVCSMLADPKKLENLKTVVFADEVKEIYSLCNGAGVADLAEKFIAEGRNLAWVKNRLKNAATIRARCAAARMPHRAAAYIRAGAEPEEVSKNLLEIQIALAGPEIDNRLGPEAGRGKDRPVFDRLAIEARYGKNHFARERDSLRNLAGPLIRALQNLPERG